CADPRCHPQPRGTGCAALRDRAADRRAPGAARRRSAAANCSRARRGVRTGRGPAGSRGRAGARGAAVIAPFAKRPLRWSATNARSKIFTASNACEIDTGGDCTGYECRSRGQSMIPKKPAPDLIRGGYRFSEKRSYSTKKLERDDDSKKVIPLYRVP